MKLYYFPAACSLAPHIALREAGAQFTLVRLDPKTGALEGGGRIEEVNEQGYVPVLELDDGERLTEVSAILGYIAELAPALAPPAGTMARHRLAEWLNFIATELHKPYWPLFHDGADIENEHARARLGRALDHASKRLGDGPYLMGEQYTVADPYLLVVVNWMKPAGLDPARWPRLSAFRARMRERPAVVAALQAEGLMRKGQ